MVGWFKLIRKAFQEVLEDEVVYRSVSESDEGTHQNVTEIMHAKVHARIARDNCPKTQKQRELASPDQIHGKKSHTPRVGGMRGRKAMGSSTITLHNMY